MNERDFDFDEFAKNLTEARLDKIIDKEKLDEFHTFVRNRGFPAKGFVISMPLTDGRLWAEFRIGDVTLRTLTLNPRLDLHLEPTEIYIGEDLSNRTARVEIQDLPVWWLDEQMQGIIATGS